MTRKPFCAPALLALLLALTLGLSGCGLVVKDPAVDARQVIVSVNGETIDKAAFTNMYNNAYNSAYQEQSMYLQYGIIQQINIPADELLTKTLDSAAEETLLHQKARELGLDQLSEEENARADADAAQSMQGILDEVKTYFFEDSELTGEELDAAMLAKAAEFGYTPEAMRKSAAESIVHEKLHAWPGRDVTVTDEEVTSEFNTRVETARTTYTQTPAQYGDDLNGGTPVYYAPAGYRYAKQVLIALEDADNEALSALDEEIAPLETALQEAQAAVDAHAALVVKAERTEAEQAQLDEQLSALTGEEIIEYGKLTRMEAPDEANTARREELRSKIAVYQALTAAQTALAEKAAQRQALEDAAFAKILPKAEEVRALLAAPGADVDALIAEHNEDPGMPEAGYAVSAATTQFVPEFTAAAMALQNIGDVSEPVKTNYGYHILIYSQDIPEGAVARETVAETIRAELLDARKEAAYEAALAEWKAAADIQLFPDRMKD